MHEYIHRYRNKNLCKNMTGHFHCNPFHNPNFLSSSREPQTDNVWCKLLTINFDCSSLTLSCFNEINLDTKLLIMMLIALKLRSDLMRIIKIIMLDVINWQSFQSIYGPDCDICANNTCGTLWNIHHEMLWILVIRLFIDGIIYMRSICEFKME